MDFSSSLNSLKNSSFFNPSILFWLLGDDTLITSPTSHSQLFITQFSCLNFCFIAVRLEWDMVYILGVV